MPATGTYVTASARPWLVDPVRDLAVIVLAQRRFETASAPQVHRHLLAAAYQPLGLAPFGSRCSVPEAT
jgi:hypothetical protein